MYDLFDSIIHSSYAELFAIDAALFLLAALGVSLILFAKKKIKKHSKTSDSIIPTVIHKTEPEQSTTAAPNNKNQKYNIPSKMENSISDESSAVLSLDAEYAKNNGLIVCKYCETMNSQQSRKCCACGNEIKQ